MENEKSMQQGVEGGEKLIVNGQEIKSGQILDVAGNVYRITVIPERRVVSTENIVTKRPGGAMSFEEFKEWIESNN